MGKSPPLLVAVIWVCAAPAFAVPTYQVDARATALNNFALNQTMLNFHERDGVTNVFLDTGYVMNPPDIGGAFARAAAGVDLATGELSLFLDTGGDPTRAGGLASASFEDTLIFDLGGLPSAQIGFSFTVTGELPTDFRNVRSSFARITMAGNSVSSGNSCCEMTSTPITYSGMTTVFHGHETQITAFLSIALASTGKFDLLSTGAVALDLPDGVSFMSASGVFLAQNGQGGGALPEPSSALLLVGAIACLGVARRNRSV